MSYNDSFVFFLIRGIRYSAKTPIYEGFNPYLNSAVSARLRDDSGKRAQASRSTTDWRFAVLKISGRGADYASKVTLPHIKK